MITNCGVKIKLVQVMLTTRNVFIATLAVSDILLCSFTMPLTCIDILTNYWTLGQNMVQAHNTPCQKYTKHGALKNMPKKWGKPAKIM